MERMGIRLPSGFNLAGDYGDAWISYTPVVAGWPSGKVGAYTATGKYMHRGSLVCTNIKLSLTSVGSAGAGASVQPPTVNSSGSDAFLPVYSNNSSGSGNFGEIPTGSQSIYLLTAKFPMKIADGNVINISGCYQTQ